MREEELKIYLRLSEPLASRFIKIKEYLGLKNDTEVIRALINFYWREHKEEMAPRLEHFNLNENGVMILDRELKPPPGRIIQVYFRPEKVWCEYCSSDRCRHVEFALNIPKVQEILRKKGWKIEVS